MFFQAGANVSTDAGSVLELGAGFDGSPGKTGASGTAIFEMAFPMEAHEVLDLGRGVDGVAESLEQGVASMAFEIETLVSTHGVSALKLGAGFDGPPGKAGASATAISGVAFSVKAYGPTTDDVLDLVRGADGVEQASEFGVAGVAFQVEAPVSTDDGLALKLGADDDGSHKGGDDEDETNEESI